jgi:hypothetical protein
MHVHVLRSQRSQLPQSASAVQPVHSFELLLLLLLLASPLLAVNLPSVPAVFFMPPAAIVEHDDEANPENVEPSANVHVISSSFTTVVPVVAVTPGPARIFAVLSEATTTVSSPGVRPAHWK